MENSVVTLDTAKLLKAAGFPQEGPVYCWASSSADVPYLVVYEYARSDFGNGYAYIAPAPTAQEIADQLPRRTFVMSNDDSTWYAKDGTPFGKNEGDGDTMAEALAALYLKLHAQRRQLSQGEGE